MTEQDSKFEWLEIFDARELKAIRDCIRYGDDPYGDIGHNLKVIIFKFVALRHHYTDELFTALNDRIAYIEDIEERRRAGGNS